MDRSGDIDRRTYVKGVTAAALLGGVPVAVSATQGQGRGQGRDEPGGPPGSDDEDDGDDVDGRAMEIPVARPFVGDLDGDMLSGDMAFQVENRYDGDPAADDGGSGDDVDDADDADGGDGDDPDDYGGDSEDDREWVLHYTTDGADTQDYPAALLNLRARLEDPVTLEALQADGQHEDVEFLEVGGGLAFDYYVGEDHEQYIPGQVYLVVQTADQAEEDRAWGLYRNVRKGGPMGEWRTLDVVEEMATDERDADGRDPVWHALEIDVDPEGFRAEFETFSDAILERAVRTRDQEGDGEVASFGNVFQQLEGADAELLAVGVGSGSSRTPTVRDIYYDDLRLTVDGEDHAFEFPAALQMDCDFGGRGQVTATLSLPTDQEDVDLDDVDEDSIRLYPYAQVMPPIGEGAEPSQVDVGDDEIEARFPPGRVRDLEGLGGGDQLVAVAGRFDHDHGVWFFGVGEASVQGN